MQVATVRAQYIKAHLFFLFLIDVEILSAIS